MPAPLGDLEIASQKKKQTTFDITNYPPSQKGRQQTSPLIDNLPQSSPQVPGNADRARRMQAQFDQPVTRGASPLHIASGIVGFGAGKPGKKTFDMATLPVAPTQRPVAPLIESTVLASARQQAGQAQPEYIRTGVNGVAMSLTDGIPTFTNDQQAYQSAQTMPAGGKGRIGDGVGTFSQMEPGTSQLALDRFERANQERGKMVQAAHANELGNNGGRMTVVRDSSRSPTLADRQRSALEERQVRTDALRAQTRRGLLDGLDQRQTGQLQRQRLQQEIQAGGLAIDREQALGSILAGLNNPNLKGEERDQAERSYLIQADPKAYMANSTKGGNPLPAAIQRLEDDDLSAIGSARTMNSELARIDNQIASGELSLGMMANTKSSVLNAVGAGDQNARNYASLNSTLEKLRNESLRLNTGVQTEGDAQRAWNELVTNLKNPELVRQRLAEISALNDQAMAIRTGIINNRRTGQGAAPLDIDSVLGQPRPRSDQAREAAAGRTVSVESDSDYEALPSGTLFIAPDGTTRRKP